jgi:nucleoside-diphosphate-sugar epimerase
MSDVLIVGAGFIGTWAARELNVSGYNVTALDRDLALGYYTRFSGLDASSAKALGEDWRSDLQEVLISKEWAAVINSSMPGANMTDGPVETIIRVLNGNVRLVHVSSLAVYGLQTTTLKEDGPVAPRTDYGRAKLAEEQLIMSHFSNHCILRTCGLYGPIRFGRGSRSARFIDTMLRRALAHGTISLSGHPEWWDEYLYVQDLARAIGLAASASIGDERIVNIGAGDTSNIDDIAAVLRAVVSACDVQLKYQPITCNPLPPLDISRARRLLGFSPEYSLIDGLRECAAFIRGVS